MLNKQEQIQTVNSLLVKAAIKNLSDGEISRALGSEAPQFIPEINKARDEEGLTVESVYGSWKVMAAYFYQQALERRDMPLLVEAFNKLHTLEAVSYGRGGKSPDQAWREFVEIYIQPDVTPDKYIAISDEINNLDLDIAKGQELPGHDERISALEKLLKESAFTFDVDTGKPVLKASGVLPPVMQKAVDDYKAWYEDAMAASNEAGYVGISPADTIRALQADLDNALAVVSEVNSWAVCGAITTPEDMMQNIERIVEITTPGYQPPLEASEEFSRQLLNLYINMKDNPLQLLESRYAHDDLLREARMLAMSDLDRLTFYAQRDFDQARMHYANPTSKSPAIYQELADDILGRPRSAVFEITADAAIH